MKDAGIDYYFVHETDRHLMKLFDRFLKMTSCFTASSITAWRHYLKEQPCRTEVFGYNYRKPHRFHVFSKGNENSHYTKSYYLSGCSDRLEAQKKADQLFYSLENQSDYVEGKSHEMNFAAGGQFKPFSTEDSNNFVTKVEQVK